MTIARLFSLVALSCAVLAQTPGHRLRMEFRNPPKAYRPMVRWW